MDRNTAMWTLVLFFGASLMFATIRDATSDRGIGLTLGLEVVAGLVLIGAVVVYMRRRR